MSGFLGTEVPQRKRTGEVADGCWLLKPGMSAVRPDAHDPRSCLLWKRRSAIHGSGGKEGADMPEEVPAPGWHTKKKPAVIVVRPSCARIAPGVVKLLVSVSVISFVSQQHQGVTDKVVRATVQFVFCDSISQNNLLPGACRVLYLQLQLGSANKVHQGHPVERCVEHASSLCKPAVVVTTSMDDINLGSEHTQGEDDGEIVGMGKGGYPVLIRRCCSACFRGCKHCSCQYAVELSSNNIHADNKQKQWEICPARKNYTWFQDRNAAQCTQRVRQRSAQEHR